MRFLERTKVTECPCHLITVTFDESLAAVLRPKNIGNFLGYTWFLCYTDYHYFLWFLLRSKALKGIYLQGLCIIYSLSNFVFALILSVILSVAKYLFVVRF